MTCYFMNINNICYHNDLNYCSDRQIWANSADQDQTAVRSNLTRVFPVCYFNCIIWRYHFFNSVYCKVTGCLKLQDVLSSRMSENKGTLQYSGYIFTDLGQRYSKLGDTIKFLNFQMPENFAVIYLKFKQRGQSLGYFIKMMQME